MGRQTKVNNEEFRGAGYVREYVKLTTGKIW